MGTVTPTSRFEMATTAFRTWTLHRGTCAVFRKTARTMRPSEVRTAHAARRRRHTATPPPQLRVVPRAQTIGGAGGASMDPFGSKAQGIRKQPTVVAPAGFVRPGCDASAFLQPKEADQLLAKFDSDCKAAVERNEVGLGFLPPSKELELKNRHPDIRLACESLAAKSSTVMMGICASSAADGIRTLKAWVGGMGLPRGRLHGMDRNGVAIPVNGPVFIKYNSLSGDADLSGYSGGFRGVLFTPTLVDAAFRQYGYLPLSTFPYEES